MGTLAVDDKNRVLESGAECRESKAGRFTKGVWAGHRFDITTLARHEHDVKERDIDNEVMAEIARIWVQRKMAGKHMQMRSGILCQSNYGNILAANAQVQTDTTSSTGLPEN
jgi:hypothetical protein